MTPATSAGAPGRKALLVDYGGVLTGNLSTVFQQAEESAGLPKGTLVEVLLEAYAEADGDGFVHRFERGELDTPGFEAAIKDALGVKGHSLGDERLLPFLAVGLKADLDNAMWDLVVRARGLGIATGLLSNSWGTSGYPMEQLEAAFEDLVISGKVGLRKPDPAIYELAAERLFVEVRDCAFIDDFEGNVAAARELGMFGVVHRGDVDATIAELETFFGMSLR